MLKLVCLYTRPPDPAAFDTHYREVHMPLLRQLSGVDHIEIAHVTGAPRGESPLYLICEIVWDNRAAMDACMASPEMRAVARDARIFGDLLSMHIAELDRG